MGEADVTLVNPCLICGQERVWYQRDLQGATYWECDCCDVNIKRCPHRQRDQGLTVPLDAAHLKALKELANEANPGYWIPALVDEILRLRRIERKLERVRDWLCFNANSEGGLSHGGAAYSRSGEASGPAVNASISATNTLSDSAAPTPASYTTQEQE